MNIQNIVVLDDQLKAIGFENMGHAILKHICLAPEKFTITEKLSKVRENISFIFYFEKDVKRDAYKLICYDAVLQQQFSFDTAEVEELNAKGIDEEMAQIDWKEVFNFSKRKPFNADDKTSYEKEIKISKIVENLNKLETVENGKAISIALKQKHWSEIPYSENMGTMSNGRSKSEISQRFYVSESQPAISANEAYRFLLNRWMEKEMQAKRKLTDNSDEPASGQPDTTSGSGLLRKKRIGNSKRNKSAHS